MLKLEPGKDLELTDWEALGATVDGLRARFVEAGARKAEDVAAPGSGRSASPDGR